MQQVQSAPTAVLAGPVPTVDGKKNSSSWSNRGRTMISGCVSASERGQTWPQPHSPPHLRRRRQRVGAVSDIFDAVCSKPGADALRRLLLRHGCICGSQELPPHRHGLVPHQLHRNHGARGHKLRQVAAKWGRHRIQVGPFYPNTYICDITRG